MNNLIIRKAASHLRLFAYQDGRQMSEAASIPKFNLFFSAFDSIPVQKRLMILNNYQEAFETGFYRGLKCVF
ncbi:hypothetical protein [Algoriphagus winogradskyi]|uniref:Uncharacterized protein n=1 Tax=Algoriphagus winogradskyi TaxID=237017 RepID=A0ABY1P3X0_9BACT|nr:hypothetical protein [Algoriphagus winogradskyi]SMP25125.1 hypothetical protein SAMN06265367_104143 [Algoriphagus winogradskyi]